MSRHPPHAQASHDVKSCTQGIMALTLDSTANLCTHDAVRNLFARWPSYDIGPRCSWCQVGFDLCALATRDTLTTTTKWPWRSSRMPCRRAAAVRTQTCLGVDANAVIGKQLGTPWLRGPQCQGYAARSMGPRSQVIFCQHLPKSLS